MRHERARLCADTAITRSNLVDRRGLEGEFECPAMAIAMVFLELLSWYVCSHRCTIRGFLGIDRNQDILYLVYPCISLGRRQQYDDNVR